MNQKKYFKQKAKGVQYAIWDLEFKRFKSLVIKEEFRKQYDQAKSRLATLQTEIKLREKEKGTDEYKRLEDNETRLNVEIEKLKKQMDFIDKEIHGAKPSNEYPDGVQGINPQIESFRELSEICDLYRKEL